jgi:hypothetical protein
MNASASSSSNGSITATDVHNAMPVSVGTTVAEESESEQTILETIRRLEDEYTSHWIPQEQASQHVWDQVVAEEQCLRNALLHATTNVHQQNLQRQEKQSQEATARLAQALLNDDDEDSSRSSESSEARFK